MAAAEFSRLAKVIHPSSSSSSIMVVIQKLALLLHLSRSILNFCSVCSSSSSSSMSVCVIMIAATAGKGFSELTVHTHKLVLLLPVYHLLTHHHHLPFKKTNNKQITVGDLPHDVLNLIQSLLPLEDYLRFPAVCSSWRSAAKQNPLPPLPDGIPWLVAHPESDPSSFLAFRPSPDNDRPGRTFRIPIPGSLRFAEDGRTIISSFGPLLVITNSEHHDQLHLLNPFCMTQTPLPSPATLPSQRTSSSSNRLLKVVIGGGCGTDDTYGGNIAVALLASRTLAYTRLGSGSPGEWTHLISESDRVVSGILGDEVFRLEDHFSDVVPYKDGLFFALRRVDQTVVSVDFSSSPPTVVDMTFNLLDEYESVNQFVDDLSEDYLSTGNIYYTAYSDGFIVISSPYLYLVRLIVVRAGELQTRNVYIFKLLLDDVGSDEVKKRRWVQVNSIGNCSFFLGENQSMSLSAADNPGLRTNCIYFPLLSFDVHRVGPLYDDDDGYSNDGHHKTINNLDDGSWERFNGWDDESYDRFPVLTASWVTPRLFVSIWRENQVCELCGGKLVHHDRG